MNFRDSTAIAIAMHPDAEIRVATALAASSGKVVVLPTEEMRARMMRAGHQVHAEKASESPCIASRSRAGVLAEGGAGS